jgi:hypothetical protein
MKDGSPYAFAGLWERWRDPATREPLETFTVITTDPNELVEPMHNRMPVIIQPKDYDRWLTPGDPQCPPVDLLRPFPADRMNAWKVDRKVGNVKNDTPDCIEPRPNPARTTQACLPSSEPATRGCCRQSRLMRSSFSSAEMWVQRQMNSAKEHDNADENQSDGC